MTSLAQRIFAEWLGTAFLLAAMVGSGIMDQRLAGGNVALALLRSTISTGAILVVLILVFGPISGATSIKQSYARRSELHAEKLTFASPDQDARMRCRSGFSSTYLGHSKGPQWTANAPYGRPLGLISNAAPVSSGSANTTT